MRASRYLARNSFPKNTPVPNREPDTPDPRCPGANRSHASRAVSVSAGALPKWIESSADVDTFCAPFKAQ